MNWQIKLTVGTNKRKYMATDNRLWLTSPSTNEGVRLEVAEHLGLVAEGVVCYLLGLEPLSGLDPLQRSKTSSKWSTYISNIISIVTPAGTAWNIIRGFKGILLLARVRGKTDSTDQYTALDTTTLFTQPPIVLVTHTHLQFSAWSVPACWGTSWVQVSRSQEGG